ncbi:MAG: hypothetical protein KDK41_12285 [Leptospiraceae bacterium]|nr:hypothetical protein [Leptospiraceae bacterium]
MAYRTTGYREKLQRSKKSRIHSIAKISWDAIMTLVALVNLFLIIFDFTYLQLRSVYFSYIPQIPATYDFVKGIEAEPRTESALNCGDRLAAQTAKTELATSIAEECRELYHQLFEQGAFSASGRDEAFANVLITMNKTSGLNIARQDTIAARKIMTEFWNFAGQNPQRFKTVFEKEIKPLMQTNFRRKTNFAGEYIDLFYKIDAPFLVFFLFEFLIRWIMSVKRREYIAWFLFPLYNWYDILGFLPVSELRIFRMVRLYRIYREFRENSLGIEGDDIIAFIIKKYSGIIAEEISDMVAVRILSEAQDEVKRGASVKLVIDSLVPHREELKMLTIDYLKKHLVKAKDDDQLRVMLHTSLERSATKVPTLTLVPDLVKVTLTREIGLSVYDAMQETLDKQLNTSDSLISEMFDKAFDDLLVAGQNPMLQSLAEKISLGLIENLKQIVGTKKWATPDMQHFPGYQNILEEKDGQE